MQTVEKRIAKSAKRTVDGRPLPRVWLEQAAASYKPETYAARINLEHYVSPFPDSDFCEYGTVLGLRTEDAGDGEVYLVATLEAGEKLNQMWEDGKKRSFSVEIDTDFADVGGAYLVGLAVTSYPASLGTHFTTGSQVNKIKFIQTDTVLDDCAADQPVVKAESTSAQQDFAQTLAAKDAEIAQLNQKNAELLAKSEADGAEITRLAQENALLLAENDELKSQIIDPNFNQRKMSIGQAKPDGDAENPNFLF